MWNTLKVLGSRISGWLSMRRVDKEFTQELEEHMELLVSENIRRGMTPEEARRAARLRLGGFEQLREANRKLRGLPLLETFLQDLRYGVRSLGKSPGFTTVAILTLALGIGGNTAIFSIVYGVLLRPLPFPQPDRIVELVETYQAQSDEMSLTWTQLEHLREYSQLFEYVAGYTDTGFNLATANEAEHVRGIPVSAEYFRVLGVHPAIGRDFLPEEDRGDGQRVAILSNSLWVRRFGGDPAAIGQKVLLSGEAYTVIGAMPAGFDPRANSELNPGVQPDVWVPLALVAKTAGNGENISVLARLKSGVTRGQLQSQMDIVTKDFLVRYPNDVGQQLAMSFAPYQSMIGAGVRPFLLVLLGAIGFVLLIACANVANLLLARGGLRGREIAVRIAIGASRGRLFQQLLTESLLIALAGGALGALVAYAGLGSLLTMAPVNLPRAPEIHLDGVALGFTFLVSLLTGVIFGVAPALDAMRTSVSESLKEGAGRSSASPGRARLRKVLVTGEIAMSLVLLTGAGLLVATFSKLVRTDPGFNPHSVLSMQFWLIGSKYNSAKQIESFNRALLERVESIPGVDAAGVVAAGLPLERGGNNGVRIAGSAASEWNSTDYREISPSYFHAMGIPLRQGRDTTEADSEAASRVAIVNDAFARKHFQGRNPIGERLFIYGGDISFEVVGVTGDVKSYLDRPAPPTVFIPAAQAAYETSSLFESWFPRTIVVRASVNPLTLGRAVRDAVAAVDPLVPTGKIQSMEQVLSKSLTLQSFMMMLLSLFAGLALVLASVGIFGVISYAVSQRTREIGVRMALGARPGDVLRQILGEGLRLVLIGVLLGFIAALALTKLLATFLYGVKATDPVIFACVSALLVIVSLIACFVPAHRAMRTDPVTALRQE